MTWNVRRRIGADRVSLGLHVGTVALLLFFGFLTWWRVWITGHPTSTITCACGDPSQELWLFAWVPYAISHGTNPLFTHLLEAGQGGVNIMWDANNLLASLLLSPITVLFGPVASFNVAALIGPVLSGYCFFVAIRRVTHFELGQVAGAVLYGFSPFILSNEPYGHLDLTWLFFPPLVFLLSYDLVHRLDRRPAVIGRWLGLLIVVQFFSGFEVLLITLVGVVISVAIATALSPRKMWALSGRIAVAAGWAMSIAVCILAYPAWFAAFGPRHIVGSPWPTLHLSTSGASPSSILTPSVGVPPGSVEQLFGYFGSAGPPIFLGLGLLIFLSVSAVVWYRQRLAWLMVGLGCISALLSFGTVIAPASPFLSHAAGQSHWWMPWRAFVHLPLFGDIEPGRFAILVDFAAAALLAISADGWWQFGASLRSPAPLRHVRARLSAPSVLWAGAIAIAIGAALWPIAATDDLPFVTHSDSMPAWFLKDAPRLSPGTRVLVLPTDFRTITMAMSWQAQMGLPFPLEGGYAVIPGGGAPLFYSIAPRGPAAILDRLSSERRQSSSLTSKVRRGLDRWGVDLVIMSENAPDPSDLKGFMTDTLRQVPKPVDGLWVWSLRSA